MLLRWHIETESGKGNRSVNFSSTHLVLIPSFNSGRRLKQTVEAALKQWRPVWVVVDGSTDGSDQGLADLRDDGRSLRVIQLPENGGKGEAVFQGMCAALAAGFSHALVMDADGQHPAESICEFMRISTGDPGAMILGVPKFGPEAPACRRLGRRAGNWWTNLETNWGGIDDSLFGYRVYPIEQVVNILRTIKNGRRYDFDTIIAVRLFWAGVRPINVRTPVRYFSKEDGGISHFRYLRDNLLLFRAHCGLILEPGMPHEVGLPGL